MSARPSMAVPFTDKVAVVTGGGSGIGGAAAMTLSRQGAAVLVADLDDHGGERVVADIVAAGGSASYVRVDVASEEDVQAMVSAAVERLGGLDLAVNNAGIAQPFNRTHEQDMDVFDRVLSVNARGVMQSMKAELTHFLGHGGGAIVNTASVAGLRATLGMPAYGASKHAIVGMTQLAAIEYVTENIRVNAVAPGPVMTPMLAGAAPEVLEMISSRVPMGRLGTSQEIADTIVFLLSEQASYITGQVIAVDGGVTQKQ